MFAACYFAARMFAPRYFPEVGAEPVPLTPVFTGDWLLPGRAGGWAVAARASCWMPPGRAGDWAA